MARNSDGMGCSMAGREPQKTNWASFQRFSKIFHPNGAEQCQFFQLLIATNRRFYFFWVLLFASFIGFQPLPVVFGGMTASQVVVVVNGTSDDSRTIANHYVTWRNIPDRNVVILSDIPDQETISVDQFRDLILQPLLKEIDRRGLNNVKCITYSAGFPTAIQLESDLKALHNRPIYVTPVGSINGLTMMCQYVAQKNVSYLALDCNLYARRTGKHFFTNPLSSEKAERWRTIEKLVVEAKHQEAAEAFEAIYVEMPNQFPAAYLSAKQYALAGKSETALDMLEAAVDAGWIFREPMVGEPAFAALKTNSRFEQVVQRVPEIDFEYQPTVGFESQMVWGPNGIPSSVPSEGLRHVLSTVLAVTRGQGTTLDEALSQLKRAVDADYTCPEGTFYFTKSGDVRTKTREPAFELAKKSLQSMGYRAEVVEGILPSQKSDCLGITIGAPEFDWAASGSTLMPGAIAENLTSLGGVMTPGEGQTKLTAFLRGGAAASSGTVTEPYAIQAKFPHPMIHAHYAEGATLAEAFYLSVTGPYQLLIVGDPLCKPFLNAPEFELGGLTEGEELFGAMQLKLSHREVSKVSGKKTPQPNQLLFMFDGHLVRENPFTAQVSIGPGELPPGYHELSIVSTDDSLVRRQYEQRVGFYHRVARDDFGVEMPAEISRDESPALEVQVKYPKASMLELFCFGQSLGKVDGEQGTISVPTAALGKGPVRIQMAAIVKGRPIVGAPKVVIVK
jgi:hypothetical protein